MTFRRTSRAHGLLTALVLALLALASAAGPAAAGENPRSRLQPPARGRYKGSTAAPGPSRVFQTASYSIQIVEPPYGTAQVWSAFLNNSGLLVMNYSLDTDDPSIWGHAAILENGTWKELKVPGSIWTTASSPNTSGRIVLLDSDVQGNFHSGIYHKGQYTPIPDKPGYRFFAQAINDRGVMCGLLLDPNRNYGHGLLFDASLSLFEVFDYPGSDDMFIGPGINNKGLVVGQYYTSSDGLWHTFTFDGETFVPFPEDPDGNVGIGEPNAVLNNGEIGGFYMNYSDELSHGYLLSKGRYTDFLAPGSVLTTVDAIADSGSFSGITLDGLGWHAYVATPRQGKK